MWEEAGCLTSGVLSTIKKFAKRRYNYEIRHLKRRRKFLLRDRLARLFAMKKKLPFGLISKGLIVLELLYKCSPIVDDVYC